MGLVSCLQRAFAWNLLWAVVMNSSVSAVLIGLFCATVTLLVYGPIFYPCESFDIVAHHAMDTIQKPLVLISLMNGFLVGWVTVYRQDGALIWRWIALM